MKIINYALLVAFLISFAVSISSCATRNENLELWEEPMNKNDEPTAPTGQIEPEKEVISDEIIDEPWTPGDSQGAKDTEDNLIFESNSFKKGPKGNQATIDKAFDKKAKYKKEKGLKNRKNSWKANKPRKMWVKSPALNIRSKPNRNSKPVGTVKKNDSVKVYSTNNGWSKIGKGRYLRTKHLTSKKNN